MNDYVEDKQIRDEVVQGICEAFLSGNAWSTFHPTSDGPYRRKTLMILRSGGSKFYGFHDKPFTGDEGVRFNEAEMHEAFKTLVNAGYHIWRLRDPWLGYKVTKTPFYEYSRCEVKDFAERF